MKLWTVEQYSTELFAYDKGTKVRVVTASLGNQAGVYGAGSLAFEHI